MIEYSSCRVQILLRGDTVPLHLGEKEVIVEVHVQHILLPSVVTDDEAVVAARHQAHGVHLGHGHVLPAYGSAGGSGRLPTPRSPYNKAGSGWWDLAAGNCRNPYTRCQPRSGREKLFTSMSSPITFCSTTRSLLVFLASEMVSASGMSRVTVKVSRLCQKRVQFVGLCRIVLTQGTYLTSCTLPTACDVSAGSFHA